MAIRYRLLTKRRALGFPISGPSEWYLQIGESKKGQLAQLLFDKATAIEQIELELIKAERYAETSEG